jgi:hypothetical protein
LNRSPDRSYEVMLDALLVAIKHIQQSQKVSISQDEGSY